MSENSRESLKTAKQEIKRSINPPAYQVRTKFEYVTTEPIAAYHGELKPRMRSSSRGSS